jgi:hypothetical protein
MSYLQEQIRLAPADFTLECDGGKVSVVSWLIPKRCPTLHALMKSSQELTGEAVLKLVGKPYWAISLLVEYIQYDDASKLKARCNVDNVDSMVTLFHLGDEFQVVEFSEIVRERLLTTTECAKSATYIFEKCDGDQLLQPFADAALIFIRNAYRHTWYKCASCSRRSAEVGDKCSAPKGYNNCGGTRIVEPLAVVTSHITVETKVRLFDKIFGVDATAPVAI